MYFPFPLRSEHAYAIRCKGDSAEPQIKDGEFVTVDPDQTPISGGEALAKPVDGRVIGKEFTYRHDGIVHLLSINEEHEKSAFPSRNPKNCVISSHLPGARYGGRIDSICKAPVIGGAPFDVESLSTFLRVVCDLRR
ncbi:MAG: hypothetical protein LBJ76_00340 [Candidatus Accumulibacter sp.]|nr:hypothetical protein [Accumulibacter sp.]